jgi:hypothetical protein
MPASASRSSAWAGSLVLDGEVAAVEADLDVFEQRRPCRRLAEAQFIGHDRGAQRQQPPIEEGDGFVRGLDRAVRLGLDVEMDEHHGSRLSPGQRDGHPHHVGCHPRPAIDIVCDIQALYESGAVDTPPSTSAGNESAENSR